MPIKKKATTKEAVNSDSKAILKIINKMINRIEGMSDELRDLENLVVLLAASESFFIPEVEKALSQRIDQKMYEYLGALPRLSDILEIVSKRPK